MTQARLIVGILIAAIVVAAIIFGPAACQKIATLEKENRVQEGEIEAGNQSAETATEEVGDNARADDATDATVDEAKDEVRAAPIGKSNDAALRASCMLDTYKDTEPCRKLRGETADD